MGSQTTSCFGLQRAGDGVIQTRAEGGEKELRLTGVETKKKKHRGTSHNHINLRKPSRRRKRAGLKSKRSLPLRGKRGIGTQNKRRGLRKREARPQLEQGTRVGKKSNCELDPSEGSKRGIRKKTKSRAHRRGSRGGGDRKKIQDQAVWIWELLEKSAGKED